uniref:Poly(A) RNA polymerase mitochondrial-like central palm domain-containing protein n=1 Tax=Chromera velia CCMP2878 TaxID=1169474 RepID=A0A0G4HLZ2_9ALVE|eukprot:Cvel_7483.t1-p1 / transcript=Cvel_7483.t1 / gene=Cvel_7483 / organism=Chromera_velia_CCMP2878 / gene_product=Poly(A) RNA polymerase cid11, putative / transcript_product=Poly(A) RNA polymerase cid11, putative / location=Cvel_scaffold392:36970-43664(-) / protein_length=974 / sequence_SO=supercontig / SO=protein_coding / is_pseudo=false
MKESVITFFSIAPSVVLVLAEAMDSVSVPNRAHRGGVRRLARLHTAAVSLCVEMDVNGDEARFFNLRPEGLRREARWKGGKNLVAAPPRHSLNVSGGHTARRERTHDSTSPPSLSFEEIRAKAVKEEGRASVGVAGGGVESVEEWERGRRVDDRVMSVGREQEESVRWDGTNSSSSASSSSSSLSDRGVKGIGPERPSSSGAERGRGEEGRDQQGLTSGEKRRLLLNVSMRLSAKFSLRQVAEILACVSGDEMKETRRGGGKEGGRETGGWEGLSEGRAHSGLRALLGRAVDLLEESRVSGSAVDNESETFALSVDRIAQKLKVEIGQHLSVASGGERENEMLETALRLCEEVMDSLQGRREGEGIESGTVVEEGAQGLSVLCDATAQLLRLCTELGSSSADPVQTVQGEEGNFVASSSSSVGSGFSNSTSDFSAERGQEKEKENDLCEKQKEYTRKLTLEVLALDDLLRPRLAQYRQKKFLVDTLTPLLESEPVNGRLVTFGSCENGFWTHGSDVDTCILAKQCSTRQACLSKLRLIQAVLQKHKMGTVKIIPAANVPIAKVFDARGENVCDVSVNNAAALENSSLVATLSRIDSRTRCLGRVLKFWGKRRQINDRSKGTLSTYTFMLQLFFLLQTRPVPVLPLFTDIERYAPDSDRDSAAAAEALSGDNGDGGQGKWGPGWEMSGEMRPSPFETDVDAIRQETLPKSRARRNGGDGAECNAESLGELLRAFFLFFGDERFAGGEHGRTVQIYDGTVEPNDLGVLEMRCPLSKKNVNPMTVETWRAIFSEFKRARELVLEEASLDEICEPKQTSPLQDLRTDRKTRRRAARRLAESLGILRRPPGGTVRTRTQTASEADKIQSTSSTARLPSPPVPMPTLSDASRRPRPLSTHSSSSSSQTVAGDSAPGAASKKMLEEFRRPPRQDLLATRVALQVLHGSQKEKPAFRFGVGHSRVTSPPSPSCNKVVPPLGS